MRLAELRFLTIYLGGQPTTTRTMSNARRVDVVGLGTVVVDHLVVVPEHPEVDSKIQVQSDHLQVGGPVPTALATLRRLAGRRCMFIGCWGHDAFGQVIDADFRTVGIEARQVERQPDVRTGFAHVWVSAATAQRTIAFHRAEQPVTPADLADIPFETMQAVHLDGWPTEAALAAAQRGQASGCLVALDAGTPKRGMAELIRHVDVLNVPRRFLRQFFGHDDVDRGIGQLLGMGPHTVTVTSGERGAAIGTGAGIWRRKAFAVEAVDTTGAGDVFSGALLHGTLEGWPAERALEFAMATAALKCTAIGNREPLPNEAAVERLLATR